MAETYNSTFNVLNSNGGEPISSAKVEVWRKGETYDEFLFDGTTKEDGSFTNFFLDRHSEPPLSFCIYLKISYKNKEYLYSLDGKEFGLFELILDTVNDSFTVYIDVEPGAQLPSTDNVVTSTESRFFQLIDQDSNPVPFGTVSVTINTPDTDVADLGTRSTNFNGYFGIDIRHSKAFKDFVESNSAQMQFTFAVTNAQNQLIGTSNIPYTLVMASNPLHAYTVQVTIAEATATTSGNIQDIAKNVGIVISTPLRNFLKDNDIYTLKDIRKTGGLKNIPELEGPTYSGDQNTINRLDGHARLEILSVNYAFNNSLITKGIDSFHKVLQRNYYEFVASAAAEGIVKEYEAARLYDVAKYHEGVYMNYLTAARSLKRGDAPAVGSGTATYQALLDAYNLYNEVIDACECDDCEAAVSPFAYLADLIDYAEKNIIKNERYTLVSVGNGHYNYSDPVEVTAWADRLIAKGALTGPNSFLEKTLHQPFYELRDDCDELNKMICKYRLQVEVLYAYLVQFSGPTADCQVAQYNAEINRYLQTAYFTLLEMLGTSYEELRNTRKGTAAARTASKNALAEQIGIVTDYEGTDTVDALFLDPNVTDLMDPRCISVNRLEIIFGLRNFSRPALSDPTDEPKILTWMIAFTKQTWVDQDFAQNDFIDGVRPVIDPDLIGPQDMVYPYVEVDTELTNPALTIWKARREWMDQTIFKDILLEVNDTGSGAPTEPVYENDKPLSPPAVYAGDNSLDIPDHAVIPLGSIFIGTKIRLTNAHPAAVSANEVVLTVKSIVANSHSGHTDQVGTLSFYEMIPSHLGKDNEDVPVPLNLFSISYAAKIGLSSIPSSSTLSIATAPSGMATGNGIDIVGTPSNDGLWKISSTSTTTITVNVTDGSLISESISDAYVLIECTIDLFEVLDINSVSNTPTKVNFASNQTVHTNLILILGSTSNDGIYEGSGSAGSNQMSVSGLTVETYSGTLPKAYVGLHLLSRGFAELYCYDPGVTIPSTDYIFWQSESVNQGLYKTNMAEAVAGSETELCAFGIVSNFNSIPDNREQTGKIYFTKTLSSPTIDLTDKKITAGGVISGATTDFISGATIWLCTSANVFAVSFISINGGHTEITYSGTLPSYLVDTDILDVVYINQALHFAPVHQQTPNLKALFNTLTSTSAFVYSGSSPVNPWSFNWGGTYGDFTTNPEKLLLIRNDLVAGTNVELITDKLKTEMHIGVDAFIRLMIIYDKYKAQENSYLSEKLNSTDISDLYNICLQCVKEAFYEIWIDEEADEEITMSYRYFWQSQVEPVVGDLPPAFPLLTPVIEPDNLAYEFTSSSQLFDGADGAELWTERDDDMNAIRQIIRNIYDTRSADDALLFALNKTAPADTSIDDLLDIVDSLGSDVSREAMLRDEFGISLQDFVFLFDVRAKAVSDVALPSAPEVSRFVEILAQLFKRKYLYPVWINEESDTDSYRAADNSWWLYYYKAFRLRIPAWRASINARNSWQQSLVYANRLPNVDPDLLGIEDFFNHESFLIFSSTNTNPAADIWNERRLAVQDIYTEFIDKVNDTLLSEADKVKYLIKIGLGIKDITLFESITEQVNAGVDIRPRLVQLHLTMAGFKRLSELYDIAKDTGVALISSEWHEVVHICVQGWKERLNYSVWNTEEKDYGPSHVAITINPDYFVVPAVKYEALSVLYKDEFTKWRASNTKRKAYEKKLKGRINQLESRTESLNEVLRQVDEMTLPILRDALVQAAGFDHQSLANNARYLSDQLLMDFQINCCQYTTRVSQAIDSLQMLIWQTSQNIGKYLRYGSNEYYGMHMFDPQFESNWEWLGTYATWRSAMFVFLYPENLLLPQLKRDQSPGFRKLIQQVRNTSQFTPAMACRAARDYSDYFEDTAKIEVMATCTSSLNVSFDECASKSTSTRVCHFMTFGRGPKTGKIYWNRFPMTAAKKSSELNLTDSAFWEPIEALGTDVIKIVGTVPYTLPNDERWLLLYCIQQDGNKKKLVYLRFNLDNSYWETSAEDLTMPDWTDYENIVVRQTQDESNESQPLFFVQSNDIEDRAVYRNYINKFGKDWEFDDWERVKGGAIGAKITKLLAAVGINGDSKKDSAVLLFELVELWKIGEYLFNHKSISYQPFSKELDFGQHQEVVGVDMNLDDLTFISAINYDEGRGINVFYKKNSSGTFQKSIKISAQGLTNDANFNRDIDIFQQFFGDILGLNFWGIPLISKDKEDIKDQIEKGQKEADNDSSAEGNIYTLRLYKGGISTTEDFVTYKWEGGEWGRRLPNQTSLGGLVGTYKSIEPDVYRRAGLPPLRISAPWTNGYIGPLDLGVWFNALWILKVNITYALVSIIERLEGNSSGSERAKYIPEDLKLLNKYFTRISNNREIPLNVVSPSGDTGEITLFDMMKAYCWANIRIGAQYNNFTQSWSDGSQPGTNYMEAKFTYYKRHNFSHEVPVQETAASFLSNGSVFVPNWGGAIVPADQLRYCLRNSDGQWMAVKFSAASFVNNEDSDQEPVYKVLSLNANYDFVQTLAKFYSISENITSIELQAQAGHVTADFHNNLQSLPKFREPLKELYYFVPMVLGMQLEARSYFEEAIQWFKVVYDYTQAEQFRRVYAGLGLDDGNSNNPWQRPDNWLQDPLNPHALALTRQNSYYKYTVSTIANCFIEWGNSEFAIDTVESVSKARELYELAEDLLHMDIFVKQKPEICELDVSDAANAITCELSQDDIYTFGDYVTTLVNGSTINIDRGIISVAIPDISDDVLHAGTGTYSNLYGVFDRLHTLYTGQPGGMSVTDMLTGKTDTHEKFSDRLLKHDVFENNLSLAKQYSLGRTDSALSLITGKGKTTWLSQSQPWMAEHGAKRDAQGGSHLDGNESYGQQRAFYAPNPSSTSLLFEYAWKNPDYVKSELSKIPYMPISDVRFCIPPNPVYGWMSLTAEMNLFKIRNCMNIAGMRRELEPYSAPTDTTTGIPTIGSNGQIVVASNTLLQPSDYRYDVIIERAKQQVAIAQQIETAFLSALEKTDAERYTIMKAKQDLQLSKANVTLKNLSIKVSEDGVTLSQLQKERAELNVEGLDDMINAGLNEFEEKMQDMYWAIAGLQASIAAGDFLASMGSQMISVASTQPFLIALANAGLATSIAGFALKTAGSISEAFVQAAVNVNSLKAAQARRVQEWSFQKTMAQQDVKIGSQQIKISQDQLRVSEQDKKIAELQQRSAEDTVQFLANKFTNAELYEWMSGVLEQVYAYFLQLATATAKMASNQIAFERQLPPPPFIQSSYWEAPTDNYTQDTIGNKAADRRGLTGSARLMEDIYKLDDYAFTTDRRKLQLSKTFSLSALAPMDFQVFKQTGVITFETLMDYFDRDFPGHYLRIIKKVKTSVIALVPPTTGIKATLKSSGVSRVVLKGNTFQEITLRRYPEEVAITGTRDATGVFEMSADTAKFLNPFEGTGVHTRWQFEMPLENNSFNYDTIADVLITIEYTALSDSTYQRQVKTALGSNVNLERAFSLRQEFADQFYELCHPDESAKPMQVSLDVSEFMFPANLSNIAMDDVRLYFMRKDKPDDPKRPFDGEVFSVAATLYNVPGVQSAGGVGGMNPKGIVNSTGGLSTLIGKSPMGRWDLAFGETFDQQNTPVFIGLDDARRLFGEGKIDDVILVISFNADLPITG